MNWLRVQSTQLPSHLPLPEHQLERLLLIQQDFRQTYFGLVGSTVNQWYDYHHGVENFIDLASSEQARIRTMDELFKQNLAGEVMGIGTVLAKRLSEMRGVSYNYVNNDIYDAVNSILTGNYGSVCSGVRKLGYWSGFSRAIGY